MNDESPRASVTLTDLANAITDQNAVLLGHLFDQPGVASLANAREGDVSLLDYAIVDGNVPAARVLLERGADAKAADSTGATPLHRAAIARHGAELCLLLLEHGANVNARSGHGLTPVDWAHRLRPENAAMLRQAGGLSAAELDAPGLQRFRG